jgi:hypothetical protein
MRFGDEPELMGFLGLSWQEKIASDLYNLYEDPALKNSVIGSLVSGSKWNISYIDQIESAYKDGYSQGYRGGSLADYLRSKVQFASPAMADSYVNLRGTVSGGSLENVVGAVVNPIGKAAGGVVSSVASPLTKPLAIVAVIAVAGLIMYSQIGKSQKRAV